MGEEKKGPRCVGIIMDGNRRWAKERGLLTLQGHRQGYEKLKKVLEWSKEVGVTDVVVYGFSTENWNRSEEEINYLMDLFREVVFGEGFEEIKSGGGRLRFAGQRERFPEDIQKGMIKAEEETKGGKETLWLGLSYGGRAEIIQAVKKIVEEKLPAEDISEESFAKKLWTAGMPDPDLIIRTSGEQRLSGFLPWQGVYSELFFTKTYWPAFSKEEFRSIIEEYAKRQRRFGK